MAIVRPFICVRPNEDIAEKVAALPYDVFNREEAKKETLREYLSFLKVDRAETQLPESVNPYDPIVYQKAKEVLENMMADKILITDGQECYYIYELIMEGRSQTGIVACASIDDYLNDVILKHENTREDKEIDRITHVDTLSAHTGPIFLAYRSKDIIDAAIAKAKKEKAIYNFTSIDGVTHIVWRISMEEEIETISKAFVNINQIYIADGHHRTASAVKVGLKRREANPNHTANEEYNYFLSVLFPDKQLKILAYNRGVHDLNGLSEKEFLDELCKDFIITVKRDGPYEPEEKGTFGMYLEDTWYKLEMKSHGEIDESKYDPVASLDVSLLHEYILHPILGIGDPRNDKRIDFIGGIRGTKELEKRVSQDLAVAFTMYPTSIKELFEVSDAGKLMPPKSTWFEPKLRSGLFIHKF
ncbi:MAG TPA: DUF1015 domain-containing protein [Clostridiales bacterium]|nr:DUF1015 domain-containing protein [Clostridiales bacterium]